MDLGLTGRLALVTGADSGTGWHTARLLLAEGATVVVSDLDQATLDAAAEALDAPAGRLHAFAADITDVGQLAALHGRVAPLGQIDVLVQSAGVPGAQGLFHEIDDEGWTSTLTTDLLGPVRLVREFLPDLRTGGWGRWVFLTSEDASRTTTSCPTARPRQACSHWPRGCLAATRARVCWSTASRRPSSTPR